VTTDLQDINIEVKTYPVRLRERGQITMPQIVRESLNVAQGDILTLLQIGDLVLLTPRKPQVPQLAEQIVAIMEDEKVSLADLLLGLQEERKAIYRERYQDNA
jgi:bifunctional DNA-binding transcriptional regulator/antitoxin component of YhaV-PrlF toxin-antitoxin module